MFALARNMQVMCEIFLKSLYIFRFDKEEEVKFSVQKDFGHMLGNGFLADSVISVAVHTRRSWKVRKSDS